MHSLEKFACNGFIQSILKNIAISVGLLLFIFSSYVKAEEISSKNITLNAQEIYQKVSKSIFSIAGVNSEQNGTSALGSAVAIGEDVLATNCHVALARNFIMVRVDNKDRVGRLLYQKGDLCLVEVPNVHFDSVNIRPSKSVKIGEEVFAIGNPEGYDKTISRGIVSNKYENEKGVIILQTDAAISHGSSGGGLFDNRGYLIGLTTSKDKEGTNIGFVIPTELILETKLGEESPPTPPAPTTSNNPIPAAIPQTADTSNLQKTTSSISNIGVYGKSNIGLFKIKDSCFISIPGRNDNDQLQSLSIWEPEKPTTFFVFPFTASMDTAFQNLSTFFNQKENPIRRSSSYLVMDDVMYELVGRSSTKDTFPVLFANVPQNPTKLLMEGDFFLAQFKDLSAESGYITIQFDLWGFSEALAAYRTYCQ